MSINPNRMIGCGLGLVIVGLVFGDAITARIGLCFMLVSLCIEEW